MRALFTLVRVKSPTGRYMIVMPGLVPSIHVDLVMVRDASGTV